MAAQIFLVKAPPGLPIRTPLDANGLPQFYFCRHYIMPLFTKRGNRRLRKAFRRAARKTKNVVEDVVQDVKDFTRKVWYGRQEFSPKAKAFLERHGDTPVVSMTINRDAIMAAVQGIMDVFGGRSDYDKLFHLRAEFVLEGGSVVLWRKMK